MSTGTTSFHAVATRAGLRAAHTLAEYTACKDERCLPALGALLRPSKLDMDDGGTPVGRAVQVFDAISDIPMMMPRILAQCETTTAAACVASNRSMQGHTRVLRCHFNSSF